MCGMLRPFLDSFARLLCLHHPRLFAFHSLLLSSHSRGSTRIVRSEPRHLFIFDEYVAHGSATRVAKPGAHASCCAAPFARRLSLKASTEIKDKADNPETVSVCFMYDLMSLSDRLYLLLDSYRYIVRRYDIPLTRRHKVRQSADVERSLWLLSALTAGLWAAATPALCRIDAFRRSHVRGIGLDHP